MNEIAWIQNSLAKEGVAIPSELETIIERGKRQQPPFSFLDAEGGKIETEAMHHQFAAHQVIAFARRWDYDGVVCFVLADPIYQRGQVLVLHDDAPPGFEIDDEFASLAAWAKAAEEEIDERIRMGWNEPIKNLLD